MLLFVHLTEGAGVYFWLKLVVPIMILTSSQLNCIGLIRNVN